MKRKRCAKSWALELYSVSFISLMITYLRIYALYFRLMLQFLNTYFKFSAKGCNGIHILFCERNARMQFVWKTTKWTDRRRLQSFTRTNRTRWRHLRPRMHCTKSWYRSLWIQSFTWYRYCSIYITISRWRRLFYIRAMNKHCQQLSFYEYVNWY